MDLATVIGLVLANGLIFVPIILSGYLSAFVDVGSVMIVIGGSTAAIMVSYPMADFIGIGKVTKAVFFAPKLDPQGVVNK